MGPWNPRNKTTVSSGVSFFASYFPDLELKKSKAWECQWEQTTNLKEKEKKTLALPF